jgi:uncharacterized membrane protein YeiH
MLSAQPSLPFWVEIAAMATTGAYGAAVARSRNVPVSGTLFAGIMMGLGGGMARDVLLGEQAVAISNIYLLPSILAASILGAFAFYRIVQIALPNLIIHGIAFGLLISIGCQKALSVGTPALSAIFCGVVTASVGGMAIDALTKHRSAAFSQAHWTLTSLIIGSTLYWALTIKSNFYVAIAITVIVTTTLFVVSVKRNWPSPKWPGESSDMNA